MALKSYALTTVQRAADWMELGTLTEGSAKYTKIELLVNSVTDFIENYTGRRFKKTSYTNELYDTEAGDSLQLKNYPVISSESFVLQRRTSAENEDEWESIDSKNFFLDYDTGIIKSANRLLFDRTHQGYRVTYTAGYDFNNSSTFLSDISKVGDIELAAWLLIASVYQRKGGSVGIQSERVRDYSVVYRKSLFENEDIQDLLDAHSGLECAGVLTPYHY